MERSLGLMCGAGTLPARMAAEATRQGWRVVAFAFGDAPGLEAHADLTIASRVNEIGVVLAALQREQVSAVLFSGKFWLGEVLRATEADDAAYAIADRARSLGDSHLAEATVTTLAVLGIDVLDQREFVGDWLRPAGCWTARRPTDDEWTDIRHGIEIARICADARIGQTVVIKRGAVAAVEAIEGTTATVKRGAGLAGPGVVVVKAVAARNDYRFDVPAIGPETVESAAANGVAVIAIEANRVLLLEPDTSVAVADRAGLAIVGVDDARATG